MPDLVIGDLRGNEVFGENGCGCESTLERLALQAVALNDPYLQAAGEVAALDQVGSRGSRVPPLTAVG